MEVFVINLRRSKARREHMARQLHALGITPRFFAAVDGANLRAADAARYDRRKALRYYGSEMTPAEIACCLSHYAVLETIIREGQPYALILEDDVIVDPDLMAVCDKLVSQTFAAWEVVRLQCSKTAVLHPTDARSLGTPICAAGRRTLYRLKRHVLGAGGYLVTLEGACKLVRSGRTIFLPFDHAMDRFWENGILPYIVRPFPVAHRFDVASEIGVRGRAAYGEAHGMASFRGRVRRLSDSLQKRAFNLCLEDRGLACVLAPLACARTALRSAHQLRPRDRPLAPAALDRDGPTVARTERIQAPGRASHDRLTTR